MKGFITVFLVGCIAFVIATTTSGSTVSKLPTPSESSEKPSTAVANVNIPSEGVADLKREARQLSFDIPFQPSPQDQFKPDDQGSPLTAPGKKVPEDLIEGPPEEVEDGRSKIRGDNDDFEGRSITGPSLELQSTKGKLSLNGYEDDANNTIDTASSGHYGHQIHEPHGHCKFNVYQNSKVQIPQSHSHR